MTMIKLCMFGALAASCGLAHVASAGPNQPDPRQRRQALLEGAREGAAALPQLAAALNDTNMVVRRTAIRLLIGMGEPAAAQIRAAVTNADPAIRRVALMKLETTDKAAMDDLAAALGDPNERVRMEAARILAGLQPRTKAAEDLLKKVSMDTSHRVRGQALKGLFGAGVRKSMRQEFLDLTIIVVKSFPLPAEGWRFRKDPAGEGDTAGWYLAAFDDREWDETAIEKRWPQEYPGVAWYRKSFEMPPAEPVARKQLPDGRSLEGRGLEIQFGGIDEGAWVWINGAYAGDHDIGPNGGDEAFALDITDFVKWGATNQVAVRVMNPSGAGGIWRPVKINFLDVQ